MRLNDTTRSYFERLASISTPEQARRYREIVLPDKAPAIEQYFREHEIMHNSILRTSISPNVIKAGFRSNVIPSTAEAILDIRALPDENITDFYAKLKAVIDDPQIEIVPNRNSLRPVAPPSRLDTEVFRVLESLQKEIYPTAITLPYMVAGATDMAQLRAKGIQCYGIGPLIEDKDRLLGGAHGDDEKVLEEAFHRFVEFQYKAVVRIAGANQ
jgi:acetylornithine deacetylase/succinyl-diaminopimelate desuccinylase-like protein